MNKLSLFFLLRKNNRLSYRRSPAFEQSVIAQVMLFIGAGFMAVYLIFIGTMLAMAANSSYEPGLLVAVLPVFLAIDFALRFMIQQTPAMLVKPYLLLPLPRHTVIEHFLINALLSGYNLLWLTLFLPYAIITFAGGASFATIFSVLLSCMLLLLANSQWYLLVRTLIGRSLLWWILPVTVYAAYFVPMLLSDDYPLLSNAYDAISTIGVSGWMVLMSLSACAVLLFINRQMQFRFAYEEVAKARMADAELKTVSQLKFLDHLGQSGEYLKLEVKSILRNKAIRSRVLMSLALIIVLSGIITYTSLYDGRMELNFWCYYCFGLYGMTTLVKVMGPEGNYIDLLMVHKENILLLLKAKYYFHVTILMIPCLIMIPAVIAGKFSVLMMLAYLLLTSGVLYFILYQLAVYNKQTLPLDKKITGKGNVENGLQLVMEMLAMFVPMAIMVVMFIFFEESTVYLSMLVLGALFTIAHPLWLRYIYRRFMARRYENLEGFHSTR